MQVFEFYFNPKLKPDLVFNSFCYEPENIYERRVGSLYLVGVLKNALPKDRSLLDKLSKIIKDKYYSPTARSPEKCLKQSLKRANQFLEDLLKRGNVSWLGNLSFATLSIKNLEFNFSKVGDLKIFLLRGKRIVDIDKKVKFEEIEPYPLKIFLNFVAGKLAEDDIVLVLSKEVFEFFQKEDLLNEFAKISPSDNRKLMEIFNKRKEKFREVSGVCLLILLSKEKLVSQKTTIAKEPKTREFSLKEVLSPLISFFKKIRLAPLKLTKIRKPEIKFPKITLPQIKFPKIAIPFDLKDYKKRVRIFIKNKNTILVLSLILLLSLGFFIFQREAKQQLKKYQTTLSEIQEEIDLAESLLILESPQSTRDAESIFEQAWEEISPIVKVAPTLSKDFQKEALALKEKILENLYELNKLVKIPEPELFLEFKLQEFVPQKIVSNGENLYFFSPYTQKLAKVNIDSKEQKFYQASFIEGSGINSAFSFNKGILFFSKPNKIINFENDSLEQSFSLQDPYPDFNFNDFSVFKSNLYFLDKKRGQIIKYSYLGGFKWDLPELWLEAQTERAIGANSMIVDGRVWILNKSSIEKYYGGKLQETLELDIFPYSKNLTKIFTSPFLPYLYILEPAQSRIIIIDKSGKIIQQFQSDLFNNLLDFAISRDGKTIFLLNGLRVYKIYLTKS